MQLGLTLYRLLIILLSPLLGLIMRYRARRGKEDNERLHERFARNLPARPTGHLIWMHAASVGESQILMEVTKRLLEHDKHLHVLLTCQTQTAAQRILATGKALEADIGRRLVQQMAPLDTTAIMRRFLDHWNPSAAIFAESEVWPNTLLALEKRTIPTALINARMTDGSLKGWQRWPTSAKRLFGQFQILLASDARTQQGLTAITGRDISKPGNLKSALPVPPVKETELTTLQTQISDRKVLLAASTHEGEEELVLDALEQISPQPFLILAPRHPERGEALSELLKSKSLIFARRSLSESIQENTTVLLADTLGEMGLWIRLADTVYLGGGHTPNVGGHNPLEMLRLGKPVVTGPDLFNFADMTETLRTDQGFQIVEDAAALAKAFPVPPPSESLLQRLEDEADAPMVATLSALEPLLPSLEKTT